MVAWVGAMRAVFRREVEGQGLVEYALILILVSVVGILALTSIGDSVLSLFSSVAATLSF